MDQSEELRRINESLARLEEACMDEVDEEEYAMLFHRKVELQDRGVRPAETMVPFE